MAICIECEEQYSDRRKALGYDTCLDCGEDQAQQMLARKQRCIAPAYNKGAYMYVTSSQMAKDLGR